jgi:hypothetical protein
MTLVKTFFGQTTAGHAMNFTRVFQADLFSDSGVHINTSVTDGQVIAHRRCLANNHFGDISNHVLVQWLFK